MSKIVKLILMAVVFFSISASATDTKILKITGDTNFGSLSFGQSSTKTITIHNNGNSSLHISNIYLHPYIKDNYSFTKSCIGTDIEAGGECNISITFSPNKEYPPKNNIYSGLIYIVSNKTAGNPSKYLKGSIKDSRILRITGDTDFGSLSFGQSSTKTITIHNNGNSSLHINKIYLHPYIKYNYSFTNSCIGTDIEAGGECNVSITFSPDKNNPPKNNIYNGLIYVESNKTSGNSDKLLIGSIIDNGNHAPIANAGADQTIATSDTQVQLDGSASSDVDGDPLTYTWTIIDKPNGSNATLSDSTLVNPTFVADKDGTYTIQLIVNDGELYSATDSVIVTVGNTSPVPSTIDPTSFIPEFD